MKDFRNYSLLRHNSFGIEVRCDRFVEFSSVEELLQVIDSVGGQGSPFLVIGGGSNLLFTGDYHGTVLHSSIMGIEVLSSDDRFVRIRVGSGENWDEVVRYCVEHDWYGAENLSIIPGEVGASAIQNIGAYGVEVKDLIESVEVVEVATGKRAVIDNAECRYAYRQSRFKQEWKGRFVVTHVVYRLCTRFVPRLDYGNIRAELTGAGISEPTASDVRQAVIRIRNAKLPDPEVQGNAGSFFMNPIVPKKKFLELAAMYPGMPHYAVDDDHEKIPAGWMIEQCGWKGRSLGRAGVHDKQALVLVNRGGATGRDVVELCETIRHDVLSKFGVEIYPEVNIL